MTSASPSPSSPSSPSSHSPSYEPFAGFDGTRDPGGRPPEPSADLRTWLRDLLLGARFAAGGGREGWLRTALTAVGVALGVAMLLLAAAVPAMMDARDQRRVARDTLSMGEQIKPGPDTFLLDSADTTYHGDDISGVLLQPEGRAAQPPPGLAAMPRPGQMVVSPALKKLLASSPLLRERIPYEITGTIGKAGLIGPADLYYYAGSDKLVAYDATREHGNADRARGFGAHSNSDVRGPVFNLLLVTVLVVLLLPVAVFIATAVRLGGERRDRRLAALRLVGADIRMTRRIAAGEALFGALLGLLLGAVFFLVARQFAAGITIRDISAFPSDLMPDTALTVLIAVSVPMAAVAVTMISLRRTVIEPLGVFRQGLGRRRRVWWRLLIPVAGLALLAPMFGAVKGDASINQYQIAAGTVLLLIGVTALLPWLVETVVGRLSGGPVAWQLATRRLQLNSNASARMVSGVTVAVAGAIALQMLFSAVDQDFVFDTGADPARAQVMVSTDGTTVGQTAHDLRLISATKGVRESSGYLRSQATRPDASTLTGDDRTFPYLPVIVGDCTGLRELAAIGAGCKPGSTFLVQPPADDGNDESPKYLKAGHRIDLNAGYSEKYTGAPRLWTIPAGTPTVATRVDPTGSRQWGVFATPEAIDSSRLFDPGSQIMIGLDPHLPDAVEYVRNTAAGFGVNTYVMNISSTQTKASYTQLRRGLFAGATLTMVLIGASLLVTMLEQLRDRRKLLAVLVAFGTRRSALAWSVLWQTTIPVVLGLVLACAGGIGLGAVLIAMVGRAFQMDWGSVALMSAVGAGVVLAVTLLSLPPLWRLMRPDGLHTE
ncbi:ABC transporter permease [Streptomyces cocklensis]|jgi:ABC-type antimicrobial peptide transport system permease subunit|uniref:Predicted ABC-type transport system involved in lysophospholipase L1 biosynthesis, permease component n=1 Tax=Actinacidiphila cocklensis TaxID=887465 RepID=A0A9W4GRV4_9ACTN|nr:ABC transporter permease [Actinacidiphila cocklensis]MDD1062868.1 ABC transporter permease [Actinacidiphila cocklensis]WSX77083.1 ABC transporter permease [Streptomyces sp. NBC_00899]CAG6394128.1 Predicted ABC-type transport system involved in lysophospholipase L1 biosynthesis, permease component [Actinacidiphila cocklensis]